MKVKGNLPPLHITIEQLRKHLTVADKDDLYVALEQIQEGKYLLPLETIMALGVEVLPGDTIRKTGYRTRLKRYTEARLDGTASHLYVPGGKVWECLMIQASYLMDANVADRTARIYIPEFGLGGVAGASPTSFFSAGSLSLQATEFGYLVWMLGDRYTLTVDNGTATNTDRVATWNGWLCEGGDIMAQLVTAEATDRTGLDILVKEYDLEE